MKEMRLHTRMRAAILDSGGGEQLTSSSMLKTLGELSLGPFRQAKPLLMLAYLAVQGPTARRDLRVLLWPNTRQPDASLRVAMHLLKKTDERAIGGSDPLSCDVACDAVRLLELHGQQALDAYTGSFLLGVGDLEVSPEFDEWADAQRARLARHVQDEALLLAANSMPQAAALLAERAYRLPGAPPAEPDLLRRLLALTLPGSPLEGEVRAELKTLGAGAEPSPTARVAGRMLGREAELDALLAWATSDAAAGPPRFALVNGPGGIGKSTLLRALYYELTQQNRPVVLLDAEGARLGSELLTRLLGTVAPGQAVLGTWAGAGALLGARPLVLLDGVDDMQDLSGLLRLLAAELPGARWVLAGRRALALGPVVGGEHRADGALSVHLSGLDVPAPEATLGEAASSSAVALFVREAARVRRGFAVEGGNLAVVAGLTRRLLGHPLALALAASWLRVEPLEAVYARVIQEGATLSSPGGDRDGRRGLRVVADRSWHLLSAAEQEAALRLSVCPDFDPVDAAALGVSDTLLDALLSHSFLEAYQPGSERLRLYPALAGLLQAQAQQFTALTTETRHLHARHYLTWFAGQAPESPGLDAERGNLRRAVRTALEDGTLEPATLDRLLAHHDRRGLHSSGTDTFAEIADEAEDAQAPEAVQAAAQIGGMWLAYRAGRLIDAQALAALFLQGPLAADPANRMKTLNTLACVRAQQGQWQRAGELYEQARLLAVQLGDRVREIFYQSNRLAYLLYQDDQSAVLEEIAAVERRLPDLPEQMAWQTRLRLLSIKVYLLGPDLAALKQEAADLIRWGEEHSDLTMTMTGLLEAGRLHLMAGQMREAGALMSRLKALLRHAEHGEIETDLAVLETEWLYAKGRTPQARQRALEALELARKRLNPWDFAELLIVSAADLETGDLRGAQHHLAAASGAESLVVSQRRRAGARLRETPAVLPGFDLAALDAWLRLQFGAP